MSISQRGLQEGVGCEDLCRKWQSALIASGTAAFLLDDLYYRFAGGKNMFTAWLLKAIGLFATTAGALLVLLFLIPPPRYVDEFRTPAARRAYAVHRKQVIIAVALLCLWLVMQDIAFLVL
jgi:hypothetical protein